MRLALPFCVTRHISVFLLPVIHAIIWSSFSLIRIPCTLPAESPVVRTLLQSKRIPLPADVNIRTFCEDVIQHADTSLSSPLSFINLNNDADGPGKVLVSSLFTSPLSVASSSDVWSSD